MVWASGGGAASSKAGSVVTGGEGGPPTASKQPTRRVMLWASGGGAASSKAGSVGGSPRQRPSVATPHGVGEWWRVGGGKFPRQDQLGEEFPTTPTRLDALWSGWRSQSQGRTTPHVVGMWVGGGEGGVASFQDRISWERGSQQRPRDATRSGTARGSETTCCKLGLRSHWIASIVL